MTTYLANKAEEIEWYALRKKSRLVKSNCYHCKTKLQSKNHILQQRGILNKIADRNNDVISIYIDKDPGINTYRFQKRSIGGDGGDVLTCFGFCGDCDRDLFKEIENPQADYQQRRSALLLTYRAAVNELYKIDANDRHFNLVLRSTKFSLGTKRRLKPTIDYGKVRRAGTNEIINEIHNELFLNASVSRFNFLVKRVAKFPAATSAVAGFCIGPKGMSPTDLLTARDRLVCAEFALHVIPGDLETIIVMGSTSSLFIRDSLESIKAMSDKQIIKLVSDYFIKIFETWCVSVSIHDSIKAAGIEQTILDRIEFFMIPNRKLDINEKVNFNLFEIL